MVDRSSFSLPAWAAIGAAGAVVGLLPWLVTGARLPLQNLGDGVTSNAPFTLLPMNQYFIGSMVALIVIGSAVAGIAARTLTDRRPRFGTTALVGGVLGVQLIALIQASIVTHGALEESTRASLYLVLLIAVTVVSIAVGQLVLVLIARGPVPGAAIALSMAAVVAASWVAVALRGLFIYAPQGYSPVVEVLMVVLRWMPAVLVGAVIAWCGFRTAGRIVGSIVSLAALWIGPAFFTGVGNAAGARVLANNPLEMLDYGVGVFLLALTTPEVVLPPLVVALALGVVGAIVIGQLQRSRRRSTVSRDDPAASETVLTSGEHE